MTRKPFGVLIVSHVAIDSDMACGRSYAVNVSWDGEADRINSNLDGADISRALLAPR
jgi:hypothetical protein